MQMLKIKATDSLRRRFWEKVNKGKSDECWEWLGGTDDHGYGIVSRGRIKSAYRAHRVSWSLHQGPIPEGLCVCHKCDNPPCVNPNHLFVGTHQENMRDMVEKGRAHGPQQQAEENPAAVLTLEQVKQIRKIYATGTQSQSDIAQRYPVTADEIGHIVRNGHWHDPNYEPSPEAFGATLSNPRPWRVVINTDQAVQIRRLRKEKGFTTRELGKIFEVSKTTISKILRGEYPTCPTNKSLL